MCKGLSKANRIKTLAEARAEFRRSGKSIKEWATEHGLSVALTYMVLAGKRPAFRGQSHKIAVLLGVKDGVIEEV